MKLFLPPALLSIALFTVTFAVNLQAPLYNVYAVKSGVGAAAVTFAFAAYVAGLMPTLLLLGGLSDRIGRRLPIATALLLGLIATGLMVVFPNWSALVFARFLLGVATGLATTSGTAYMAEIIGDEKVRLSALLVASATSLGFGGGALATGISLSQQGPTLLPASYFMLFVLAPVLAVIVFLLPRVDNPKPVSLLRLPIFPLHTWRFGVALALAWSTTGMTIAIVPLQLELQGLGSYTGLVIFLAIFIGFLCQPFARQMTNRKSLMVGFILVPLGFLILLSGVWTQSIWLILIGTGITSSASYGFTYLACLSEFSIRARDNRARATAGLFVYAYIGFSLPTIASGALADMIGLLPAMIAFSVFLIVITTLVVGWSLVHRPQERAKPA